VALGETYEGTESLSNQNADPPNHALPHCCAITLADVCADPPALLRSHREAVPQADQDSDHCAHAQAEPCSHALAHVEVAEPLSEPHADRQADTHTVSRADEMAIPQPDTHTHRAPDAHADRSNSLSHPHAEPCPLKNADNQETQLFSEPLPD
jgi:hypothetical protein